MVNSKKLKDGKPDQALSDEEAKKSLLKLNRRQLQWVSAMWRVGWVRSTNRRSKTKSD